MKISGKVICIKNTQLFTEYPSVLHNSLNPRLLAGMNDELPVNVSHYI